MPRRCGSRNRSPTRAPWPRWASPHTRFSHAYQDADGSRAYRIRRAVAEPLSRFAPFSAFFFIGGFWFEIPFLIVLSLIYVAGLVVFALADASGPARREAGTR